LTHFGDYAKIGCYPNEGNFGYEEVVTKYKLGGDKDGKRKRGYLLAKISVSERRLYQP